MLRNTPGYPESLAVAKAQAKRLSTAMGGKRNLSHAQALEMVAKLHGDSSWGEMSASFRSSEPRTIEPVLFTPFDLFAGLRTLTQDEWLFGPLMTDAQDAFMDITPYGVASSSIRDVWIRAAVRLARRRTLIFVDGQPYPDHAVSGRCSFVNIFDAMLNTAPPLDPAVRTDHSPAMLDADEVPRIDGKHTRVHAHDLGRVIAGLRRRGHDVIHISSESALEDFRTSTWLPDLTRKDDGFAKRAVNPLSILKIMTGQHNTSLMGRHNARSVFVMSERAQATISGMDVMMAQIRSLGGHVLVVASEPDTFVKTFTNANAVWHQPRT